MLTFLFACLLACAAAPEAGACTAWPGEAEAAEGVVETNCGWFVMPVGEHLVANVYVTEPESPCVVALDEGLKLNSSPIYSAMSNDVPKWTVDVVAEAPGDSLLVDVTCDDGTRWQARVNVE